MSTRPRMFSVLTSMGVLMGVLLVPAMTTTATPRPSEAEKLLGQLRQDLAERKIESVKVLFLPYRVLTRTRVTPELLEGSAQFKTVRRMDDSLRSGLLSAIEATKLEPSTSSPDVRWGAVFLDQEGQLLHSIYLSGKSLLSKGRQGLVDDRAVSLNEALISWFESSFPEALKTNGK